MLEKSQREAPGSIFSLLPDIFASWEKPAADFSTRFWPHSFLNGGDETTGVGSP
jgi:hypothetical protein